MPEAIVQQPPAPPAKPVRTWAIAWLAGPVLGIVNGIAREKLYAPRLGSLRAHQASTVSAAALFATYFAWLQRRRPLPDDRSAAEVGLLWLVLTVLFEFGFGRAVAREEWSELLADYDVRAGRIWPLFLAWLAVGPTVVRRACSMS